jgi:hypothetical protein
VIGIAQKDQAEDRDGIFGRLQLRDGPEFVGGSQEVFVEFSHVGWHFFTGDATGFGAGFHEGIV